MSRLVLTTRTVALAAIAVLFTGSLSLATCSSTPASATAGTGLSGKSASQVLALALAAAEAEGSVRMVGVNTLPGYKWHSVNNAGQSQGKQVQSTEFGNAAALATPSMAYLKGDATFLERLGWSHAAATTYAGKWIAIPESNSLYALVVAELTIPSLWADEPPSGTLSLTKSTTVDGNNVVGVSGGLGLGLLSDLIFAGSEVMYISTTAPYLPVESVAQVKLANGIKGTVTDKYLDWGESVSVTPPAKSVPISSIPSA